MLEQSRGDEDKNQREFNNEKYKLSASRNHFDGCFGIRLRSRGDNDVTAGSLRRNMYIGHG